MKRVVLVAMGMSSTWEKIDLDSGKTTSPEMAHRFVLYPTHQHRYCCYLVQTATLHSACARRINRVRPPEHIDRVSYDAHITIVGGRGSENVGVLLLNWDVLRPDDISTKVASNGFCGTRCAWRIG